MRQPQRPSPIVLRSQAIARTPTTSSPFNQLHPLSRYERSRRLTAMEGFPHESPNPMAWSEGSSVDYYVPDHRHPHGHKQEESYVDRILREAHQQRGGYVTGHQGHHGTPNDDSFLDRILCEAKEKLNADRQRGGLSPDHSPTVAVPTVSMRPTKTSSLQDPLGNVTRFSQPVLPSADVVAGHISKVLRILVNLCRCSQWLDGVDLDTHRESESGRRKREWARYAEEKKQQLCELLKASTKDLEILGRHRSEGARIIRSALEKAATADASSTTVFYSQEADDIRRRAECVVQAYNGELGTRWLKFPIRIGDKARDKPLGSDDYIRLFMGIRAGLAKIQGRELPAPSLPRPNPFHLSPEQDETYNSLKNLLNLLVGDLQDVCRQEHQLATFDRTDRAINERNEHGKSSRQYTKEMLESFPIRDKIKVNERAPQLNKLLDKLLGQRDTSTPARKSVDFIVVQKLLLHNVHAYRPKGYQPPEGDSIETQYGEMIYLKAIKCSHSTKEVVVSIKSCSFGHKSLGLAITGM
ncbi:hypothetical protein T439DRAFT_377505 [Meredithblackwellia eburnea MCA 4105]